VQVAVVVDCCFKLAKKIEGQTGHVNILALSIVVCIGRPLGYSHISPFDFNVPCCYFN
jgi:hypothetical protein